MADFLDEKVKVQVASIGKDGAPHLTTLFYVVRDGAIAFWTYGRSQKIRNLERDPRISCLVEDGDDYFELRGVSITGTRGAGARPGPDLRDRLGGGDPDGRRGVVRGARRPRAAPRSSARRRSGSR